MHTPLSSARMRSIALAVSLIASSSLAESTAPEGFERLIAELGADSFETRESAERALFDEAFMRSVDEPVLVNALARPDLGPEQRHRLRRVYHEWFTNYMEHAGMGVSFNGGGAEDPQVMIVRTVAGFPCRDQELLFPLDLVVAIDGVPVETMTTRVSQWQPAVEHLRAAIISRDAGDSIPLTLKRPSDELARQLIPMLEQPGTTLSQLIREVNADEGTQLIELDLPLGSYNDLGNTAALTGQPLVKRAANMRLARLERGIPVTSVLFDDTVHDVNWQRFRNTPNKRLHTDIISAGAPLDASLNLDPNTVAIRRNQALRERMQIAIQQANGNPQANNNGAEQVLLGGKRNPDAEPPEITKLLAQRDLFMRSLNKVVDQIEIQQKIADDRARPERERFLARGTLEQLELRKSQLTRQIQGVVTAVNLKREEIRQRAGDR